MNDNLSIFITVIVLVILLVIFPLYNHFERQDNMSYNLVLKSTTNFIDSVINCGYIDQQMYSNYVGEIANTGNLYDIELEAHKKIITADPKTIDPETIDPETDDPKKTLEFQDQYLVDYNEDIFDDSGKTNNNTKYEGLNEKSIKNGVYKLDVGDEIYIKVKNSGTTMAEALFKNIVPTANAKNITVNYGGIIKNNAWLNADNSVIAKELVKLKYKVGGVIDNNLEDEKYLYYGEKNVEFTVAEGPNVDEAAGERFKCWTDENSGTEYTPGNLITLTKSTTLIAKIETQNPKVRFETNRGSVQNVVNNVIENGKYINLPSTTGGEGYTFQGWYTAKNGGGEKVENGNSIKYNTDHVLYAHWTPNTYTITLDPNGGTVSSNSIERQYDGKYGSLPTPTKDKHTFKGWYTAINDGNLINKNDIVKVTNNETKLFAKWEKKIKVILNPNDGSNTQIIYVNKGGKYEGLDDMSKPTRNNCTFAGWFTSSEGGSKVTSSSDIKSNTNHTLYAHWTPNANYRITKINTSSYSVYKLSASGYLDAISTKVVSNKVYKVKSTNKQASGSGAGLQFWYIEAEDIYINKDAFQ